MSIPKVFVSYSHDTQEHKKWTLDLATRLRNNGVDAILDQWDLRPGDDLPLFMERHLSSVDRVIMICTERYIEKANSGSGGVGYEKMIVTSDMLQSIDSNKVIPVIRQSGSKLVPTFLRSKLFIDFSRNDGFEFSFDELVRAIHGAPLFVKPPVGNNPFKSIEQQPAEKTGDAILQLMLLVVADFESGVSEYTKYALMVEASGISRIMLDVIIGQAISQGLLTQDPDKDVRLTAKGKQYAINHKLVK